MRAAAPEPLKIAAPEGFALDPRTAVKRQFANAVRAWASEKFGGRTVRNLADGSDIIMARSGIKHTTARDSQSRRALAALWRLDDMLAGARPAGSEPDRLGRRNVVAAHIYEREVEFDGESARMRIVVREDATGRRYYDHSEVRGGGPATGKSPEGSLVPAVQGPPDANIGAPAQKAKPDLWDMLPAGTEADGQARHVTHADMLDDAERDGFFADLIKSCKD
ncbi:MAG: hypothetical protein KIS96_14495 [Bauldia sp.]|nr:hypothetical protein [Bauldia sp.]